MTILIYLGVLILLFYLTALSLYFLYIANTFIMRGHDLPTDRRTIKTILKIISNYKTGPNNFYDLGCGRATVVLSIKKHFPEFSVYGIDKNTLQLFFAQLKNYFLRQEISFQKADLFEADLQNADIIYTYLWYDLMPPLEEKLQKELKKGAIIITNTSNFPNWQPIKTYISHPKKPDFEKLFVYVKD